MYNNGVFKKAISVISGLCITSLIIAPGVFADSNVPCDSSQSQTQSRNDSRKFLVKDSRELEIYASKAQDGDEIVLEKDISVDCKVNIKSSICLNLNNHSLMIKNEGVISIGDRTFVRNEKRVVHHRGYYKSEPISKTIYVPGEYKYLDGKWIYINPHTRLVTDWQSVWHEPRDEVQYREIYNYFDNVNVIIKNGKIKKEKGLHGKNGIKDSWRDYNGEVGQTPSAPVEIVSGTLNLNSVKIKGGEGGKGGRGGYCSLSHAFACGGDAGNGGEGGKGGDAVYIHRKECRLRPDKKSKLKGGNGGEGGKAGKINPNYWVIPGSEGCDGREGLRGKPFNEINSETNNEEK